MVAVYDSQETFLSENLVVGEVFEVKGALVRGTLSIPYGKYAISVYHDQNSDKTLNTGIFGIPKEPVGFSNDAKGSFGPPGFKESSFDFENEGQTIKINLSKP